MARRIYQYIFGFLFFLLPFGSQFLVYDTFSYAAGGFSPWMSFLLTVPDILSLIVIVIGIILYLSQKILYFPFPSARVMGVFVLCLLPVLWIESPLLHFLWILRFFFYYQAVAFLCFVKNYKTLIAPMVLSLLIMAFIGILQFYFQKSLGLSWFGEVAFSSDVLGIAKIDVFDTKYIRSYGLFQHPNIFAAYLFLGIAFLRRFQYYRLSYFVFIPLFLTFSKAAILALCLLLFFEKKTSFTKWYPFIICLVLFFPFLYARLIEEASYAERWQGIGESLFLLWKYPFGLGISHSVLFSLQNTPEVMDVWMFQPVHNSWLLLLVELGWLAGGMVIMGAVTFFKKLSYYWKNVFFALFVISLVDHFFITSPQFIFIFFLFSAFAYFDSLKSSS